MISISKVNPSNLKSNEIEEICNLHHNFLGLKKSFITKNLLKKDIVYIFSHKETKKIIGTIAGQYFFKDNSVVFYVGAAVIDPQYQHQNFLSYFFIDATKDICKKYFFKKKYYLSFITTPKAYNMGCKFPEHYPAPGIKTPEKIKELIEFALTQLVDKENYTKNGDIYIVNQLREKIKSYGYGEDVASSDGFFEKVNPDFMDGNQLLSIHVINLKSIAFLILRFSMSYFKRIFRYGR